MLDLPENVEVVKAQGPPQVSADVSDDGRHLNFGIVREILPREKLTFRAKVVASKSGVATTVARVEAIGLLKPVIVGSEYEVR